MRSIDASLFSPYEAALRAPAKLSDYSWSLCGGPCAGLFMAENEEMLRELAQRCIREEIPFRVLGGMSNILVSDSGYDSIVILNRKGILCHSINPDGSITLNAGTGVSMAGIVRYCAENGLSGFEWAAGLPGTVGGAVFGNAGAFGTEIADIFEKAAVLFPSGEAGELTKEEMAYGYRSSALKRSPDRIVLLSAAFRLSEGDKEKIRSLGESYRETRREKQPGETSLGSVFKNPEGMSAGKLIQDAGLKGEQIGKASVSMKHANFITTEQGVRSEDYLTLIRLVQDRVRETSGVCLEPEIELLGFDA